MFCFVYLSNDTATPLWIPKKKKKYQSATEIRPLLMRVIIGAMFFLSNTKSWGRRLMAGALSREFSPGAEG